MAKRRAFPMLFTNRTEVPVPAELALSDRLLGVDSANRIVVCTDAGPRALTDCHQLVATLVPNGEGLAVCPGCDPDNSPYVDPYFGWDAIVAQTFVELTSAERNAVKQGWKIDATPTMGALRAALAAVELAPVPTVDELELSDAVSTLPDGTPTEQGDVEARLAWAEREHARLVRNAKVNAWRDRQRLQAAIDRRTATYALLRATKRKPAPVVEDAADAAQAADSAADVAL